MIPYSIDYHMTIAYSHWNPSMIRSDDSVRRPQAMASDADPQMLVKVVFKDAKMTTTPAMF